MRVLLYTLLCALAVVAIMMMGLCIKMICRKRGEFKRHCSSMDPYTGKGGGCVCGKASELHCHKRDGYAPLEVNDTLLEELK